MAGKNILITVSALFLIHSAFSQKEANRWYFGANAGVVFNSGKPVALLNSKMYSSEGCATQSAYNGRLLFYTDGNTVWDSTHKIMPNGKGLKGSSSTTQSVLILPKPYTFKQYYIFTADNVAGTDGITYSEVNMSNNMGKGDVTYFVKNKPLLSPACEKLTAIKHANGYDYWLIVHKFNSDELYAYRVTGFGVIKQPVITKTGFSISGTYSSTLGYMKFSPDGRKLAYANYSLDSTVIANFDAATGKFSNVWTFRNEDAYGIEFSPKSTYLYVGEFSTRKLFQYNCKAGTKQLFMDSKTLIDSNYSNDLGALQLGPDGKMYITVTGNNYLHVVHAPDSFGVKSRPQKDFVFLGGKSSLLGLPNFLPSYFNRKSFSVHRNCMKDTTFFTISNTNDLDSVKWSFGDPQSGIANYSKKTSDVFHIYNKAGFYNVNLFYYYKKTIGFYTARFYVRDIKPDIGKDSTFCNAFSLELSPHKDYYEYKWSDNITTKTNTVNRKGTYILFVKDSLGCIASDTAVIKNPTVKAAFSISDSVQCSNNNLFEFTDISHYDEDSGKQHRWSFGDGTELSSNNAKKEYSEPGFYMVKLSILTEHGCSGSTEKPVTVLPTPVPEFSASNPCFPEGVQFTNQSSMSGGMIATHLWSFGDNTVSSLKNPYKNYDEASKYTVKLTVQGDNGCTDSIIKHKGVWVRNKPVALFTIKEISSANNGERTVQFNNFSSEDVTIFDWDFEKAGISSEKEPILNYNEFGKNTFTLNVTNDVGCSDSYSITTYNKFYLYVPNAFTPNNNGLNETFSPVSSLYISSYKMEIFNMWGQKVFESTNLSEGWDGNYMGKPCPDGIYTCKIYLTPINESLQHYEGNIRLLR